MGWLAAACVAVEVTGLDHLGDHRGLDSAGADRVDAYASRCVFQGGAASQSDDAMLGRMVGGPAGQADQPSQ